MKRLDRKAIAFALTLPFLTLAGCATQQQMSALRTEVMTTQDMARAAQSDAAAAAEEARQAAEAARQAAAAAQRAADQATRAAKAAEEASDKADRIFRESLRK